MSAVNQGTIPSVGYATARDYADSLAAHLPPGIFWTIEPDSQTDRLLFGLGEEFARIHNDLVDWLRVESDPAAAIETIDSWLGEVSQPDLCAPQPETLQEKQTLSGAHSAAVGGCDQAYFVSLAAQLGISITIAEYHSRLARVGVTRVGEPLYGERWKHVWEIIAPAATATAARTRLECLFTKLIQSHMALVFSYTGA